MSNEAGPGLPEELQKYADLLQYGGFPSGNFKRTATTLQPHLVKPVRYPIEIPAVDEETSGQIRKALKQAGCFIVPIRPVSINNLLEQLGVVHGSPVVRATAPPAMDVAIPPNPIRAGSNLSPEKIKNKILEAQRELRKQIVPLNIRSHINITMVDPSTVIQLDLAHKAETGKILLPPRVLVWTDVPCAAPGYVAVVGRCGPEGLLNVYGRHLHDGSIKDVFSIENVFVLPVVVLPQIS